MIGRQVICSRCRRVATCRAVLDVQHAPRRVFCDQACMVLFVREVYIEGDSSSGAPAGTSSPDRRSAVSGQGEVPGAAREPLVSGKSSVAPVRPYASRWPEFLRSGINPFRVDL